ncbi:hypothetical protein PspLS_00508 [Pyricularia sp. CBS 133598]|nr:hypothetical protein PspLS_00508 [Pyricularia sp. CBS 133598]
MPIFATSQEWLHQSQLLLEARPATTRITTRYSIRKAEQKPHKDGETLPDAKPPRARLVLKTYDDVSGACLKYRTSKAAEVSRLIQMLGSLGRRQAALPPRDDGLLEPAGGAAPTPMETEAAVGAATTTAQQQPAQQQGGGGGAKGKKKKGKR